MASRSVETRRPLTCYLVVVAFLCLGQAGGSDEAADCSHDDEGAGAVGGEDRQFKGGVSNEHEGNSANESGEDFSEQRGHFVSFRLGKVFFLPSFCSQHT